jgi:hypothetical protein
MFLFKRSFSPLSPRATSDERRSNRPPYHGLFILNRQGPDNFCEDLTDEDALELTDDFVIFSAPNERGFFPDVLRGMTPTIGIYGLWVFETAQRAKIGQQMQQCVAARLCTAWS